MVERVKGKLAFDSFRSSRRRGRSGPLAVTYVADGDGVIKVAYAIGTRVGGAVVRNRLRRRLREHVREIEFSLPVGAYLIAVGKGAEELSPADLKRMAVEALRRASR